MSSTRRPSGSFCARRRLRLGKSGAQPSAVTKPRAQRIVDAYFSREHFDDRDGCCPLLGTASDVQRRGEVVKAAYQEVVEQMVKVFEDHLNEPRAHKRALALVALCVGGMVLARNVSDPDLADDFRRTAHAEVLRAAGWNSASLQRMRMTA